MNIFMKLLNLGAYFLTAVITIVMLLLLFEPNIDSCSIVTVLETQSTLGNGVGDPSYFKVSIKTDTNVLIKDVTPEIFYSIKPGDDMRYCERNGDWTSFTYGSYLIRIEQ